MHSRQLPQHLPPDALLLLRPRQNSTGPSPSGGEGEPVEGGASVDVPERSGKAGEREGEGKQERGRGVEGLRGADGGLRGGAEQDLEGAEAPALRNVPLADEQCGDLGERRADQRGHLSGRIPGGWWEGEGGCEAKDHQRG